MFQVFTQLQAAGRGLVKLGLNTASTKSRVRSQCAVPDFSAQKLGDETHFSTLFKDNFSLRSILTSRGIKNSRLGMLEFGEGLVDYFAILGAGVGMPPAHGAPLVRAPVRGVRVAVGGVPRPRAAAARKECRGLG